MLEQLHGNGCTLAAQLCSGRPQPCRRTLALPACLQPAEVEARVTGTIPAWLNGSLLINGGGNYNGMRHMFDGYALVSKLRISGGKVHSSHRFLGTKAWQAFSSSGRMKYREFATPLPAATQMEAAANIASSMAALMTKSDDSFTDNASVNVVPVADGKLLALSGVCAGRHAVHAGACQA